MEPVARQRDLFAMQALVHSEPFLLSSVVRWLPAEVRGSCQGWLDSSWLFELEVCLQAGLALLRRALLFAPFSRLESAVVGVGAAHDVYTSKLCVYTVVEVLT